MNTTQPIRNTRDLERLKAYYLSEKPNERNYLLVIICLNTALRISDVLSLQWADVYDFSGGKWKEHLLVTEKKTEKTSAVYINRSIKKALKKYRAYREAKKGGICGEQYLFASSRGGGQPISRIQAFRIIRDAAQACSIPGVISCHSLRKTFGYYAWKQGVPPVLLMNIYNHSSFQITSRYLGIEQDDRDRIFQTIRL